MSIALQERKKACATARACRRDAALRRRCVSPRNCPDLLWFACRAGKVETDRHAYSDLSRHASLCTCIFFAWPVSLPAPHSPVRVQCPFHVNLNAHDLAPIAQCRNRAETAPIAPFPGRICLASQHAVMQTTTNRVYCEGLGSTGKRSYGCRFCRFCPVPALGDRG